MPFAGLQYNRSAYNFGGKTDGKSLGRYGRGNELRVVLFYFVYNVWGDFTI